MNTKKGITLPGIVAALFVGLTLQVNAETYVQSVEGNDTNHWNKASIYKKDGVAATALNSSDIIDSGTYTVRVTVGQATFAAGTLIMGGNQMVLKNATNTLSNLTVRANDTAYLFNAYSSDASTVKAALNITNTLKMESGANVAIWGQSRETTLNIGTLTGSGVLLVGNVMGGTQAATTLRLGVANYDNFDGGMSLFNGSKVTLTSSFAVDNLSLGTGSSIAVGSFAFSFGSVSISGAAPIALDAKDYGIAELNALLGGNYFSGSGNITVIPEPSTWVLLGIGAGILAALRRKR